jgi:hypothetical protein
VSEQNEHRESDFVDKAFGQLDHVLDVFHDKVLRPIFVAGRAIAYSFIIFLMIIVLVAALVIGFIRLFNVYVFPSHQWITYMSLGGVLLLGGLILWRKRRPVKLRK